MAQSLYSMGRGRRGKKKAAAEESKKKKAPSLIRVQVDIDELELPHNVTLNLPDRENVGHFEVNITPDAGLWQGATYKFDFTIPDNYPYKPPKVLCKNKIYHPNIDLEGNICLNILKEGWRPILGTQQIIHGLIFLFMEPNPADPLNQEAAEVFRNNYAQFQSNVEKSLNGGYVGGSQFEPMLRKGKKSSRYSAW